MVGKHNPSGGGDKYLETQVGPTSVRDSVDQVPLMKTITLRNMDAQLKAALQRDAEENASSLNAAAIRAMRIGLGIQKPPRR